MLTVSLGLELSGNRRTCSPLGKAYSVMPSTEVTFCWACVEKVKTTAANTAKETFRRIHFLRNWMTWIIAGRASCRLSVAALNRGGYHVRHHAARRPELLHRVIERPGTVD